MSNCTAVNLFVEETNLGDSIARHLRYTVGKSPAKATKQDVFYALAHSIREQLIDRMLETETRHSAQNSKQLVYLSAEFLIGQSLRNNLFNLGMLEDANRATQELGFSLEEITDAEADAPLGNGGLGRLAACFMESLATLGMPAYGFGINYQFGLFKQEIEDGFQTERTEQWFSQNSPWLIERPAEACSIPLFGRIEHQVDSAGKYAPMWVDWRVAIGIPYDIPIVGFGGKTVNYLRLYSARSSDEFDMQIFNSGDYMRAVEAKISIETISKVLYPADSSPAGKELRLVQEYFMVACALRDTVRKFEEQNPGKSLQALPDRFAIQMNDTHPALVVAELMRILVDEHAMEWEPAWEVTHAVCGYTNHTLLPEALEKWPVQLMDKVLPRHLQIIYEINRRFLRQVEKRYPGQPERLSRMSLIEEGEKPQVRMAQLAIVGSHSVNGVAALHSDLVQKKLVPEFGDFWPERFNNKTNGVTHRRWLASANPGLASLITEIVGTGWMTDLTLVRGLEAEASDHGFQHEFRRVKAENKDRLARLIQRTEQITIDPGSLFDVHVKRIHEYKRQLLNAMRVMWDYLSLVEDGRTPTVARTYIFGGKAAPGYATAKLIIKLINNLAEVVNNDSRCDSSMKVVFMHDYKVSLAEQIIPAADLSEQISTAGMEASGTGNMKMAMNGALTMGTLDGANIEILEEVGEENIYIFGLTAEEVEAKRNSYDPCAYYRDSATVRRVMDALRDDRFCAESPGLFRPIFDSIMNQGDRYFHLADLESYLAAQERAAGDFLNDEEWSRKGILNVARSGKFSSDRTVAEYAREIWGLRAA
ncbi:MAG: glycogen/starch/alpha-glucan phosphorylase [Acidobacteriales bacterium]|nr:glycogen/starch/alpha-glucan phosphorylase [Terriglobales bacterium]